MTVSDEEIAAAEDRMRSVDLSYMPVYPGGNKQFDKDCQVLAAAYMTKKLPREPARLSAECRELIQVLIGAPIHCGSREHFDEQYQKWQDSAIAVIEKIVGRYKPSA